MRSVPEDDKLDENFDENDESKQTVREGISLTCKLLFDKRMAALQPILMLTAVTLMVLATTFIKMMVDTMDDKAETVVDVDQES